MIQVLFKAYPYGYLVYVIIIAYLTLNLRACIFESLKGKEKIKVNKCRRQKDGKTERQQIKGPNLLLLGNINLAQICFP